MSDVPPHSTLSSPPPASQSMFSFLTHLAQLLHSDNSISITIKQFEGFFQAVDVLPGELSVRAESLGVPGHCLAV